jgi:hypothetical protein
VKMLLGILLVVAAVVVGIYVGIWWCLIGGIVSIIEGAKANPVSARDIAFGIVRILFSGVCGWVSFALLALPGFWLIGRHVEDMEIKL